MFIDGRVDMSGRPLPPQDWERVLLIADQFRRSQDAMETWSTMAKQCVDFVEGKQWSDADLRKLAEEKRPALTINKIMPLVNLVLGYHINNRTQDKYLPGHDGTGTAEIAAALSATAKQIDEMNDMPAIDSEVFLDGIITGRGYYDFRMDFQRNIWGHVKAGATDPFTVYVDPDASDYDLNTGNYVMTTRWISPEEVSYYYGAQAASLIKPLTQGMVFSAMPQALYDGAEEVSPWRKFGGDMENDQSWRFYTDQFYNWVDTSRKTIRALDTQHYVWTHRWLFVDLESGDQRPIPDSWSPERINRALMWAEQNGIHLRAVQRKMRRLRWTHMVGDIIVFDEWSPYETMTIVPFFPWFRRGKTRGMVEDLVDPQREINVRRSARQNIVGRASNSGWKVPEGSLTPEEKRNLEQNAGRPGFVLTYRQVGPSGTTIGAPEQIQPAQSPVSIEQLEKEAKGDIEEIAGINKAALGQVDQSNVSGRAILARQQQTVVGLEGFMSNFHRSKRLVGRKKLELIQRFYTEPRIIRVIGDGNNPIQVALNQHSAGAIVNDVTLGEYEVRVDETTLTESFLAGQFNELLEMREAGLPIPDDFFVDASSIGRKDELRLALQQARQAQAAQAAAGVQPGAAPGGGGGPPARRTGGGTPPNERSMPQ